MKDALIACVGKPSAGKSSLLNAFSDAAAKVGNFPFTTIKPNHGVAYIILDCPCSKYNKTIECNPRQGKCTGGKRSVPLQILDVAGLIPGASTGAGLGNQFLDDLRHASALIHVVDVSGTTDENGKETVGYDPINDIDWLRSEIHSWIYNNLKKRWGQVVRRHIATKSTICDTLHAQLGGYGTTRQIMIRTLDAFKCKQSMDEWDDATLKRMVECFMDVRFPTVIVLLKLIRPSTRLIYLIQTGI